MTAAFCSCPSNSIGVGHVIDCQHYRPGDTKVVPATINILADFPSKEADVVFIQQRIEQINHPNHYGGDTVYEAIKVIRAWDLGFCLGNVVKYIARAGRKPGESMLKDLRKAAWYLDQQIKDMEGRK